MLYRLSATPAGPASVVAVKVVARTAVGVAQMALLFLVGWLVFDVSLGRSLVGLALLIGVASFASAGMGLLFAGAAPGRESVLPLGTMAIVAMAAVGGCWWPISMEPPWLQSVAHAFPTAWAMGGFNDLMLRNRGVSDLMPAIGVLLTFGLLFSASGSVLFWRRIRSGLA